MGTHPIFESDFDCLTECVGGMADWADDTGGDTLVADLGPSVADVPDDTAVPPPEIIEKGDQLIKISYKWRKNESTNKRELLKVTRTFAHEHQRTSRKVAQRKKWAKFGLSKGDPNGPQDSTTMFAEEVTKIKRQFEYFSFFQNFNNPGSAPKMRSNASPMESETKTTPDSPAQSLQQLTEKYVPPKRVPGRSGPGYSDEVPAIRVSNISSAATQEDLQQLFEKFGRISRIHLGRDRKTNESRGFAFINYQ